jgi:hypothetical protein
VIADHHHHHYFVFEGLVVNLGTLDY